MYTVLMIILTLKMYGYSFFDKKALETKTNYLEVLEMENL